jgi:hypothetical protein
MRTFNDDLRTVDEFFLEVFDGRLKNDAADQKASTFFSDIQGPMVYGRLPHGSGGRKVVGAVPH